MSAISEAIEIDTEATQINRRSQEFDDFYSATPEQYRYDSLVRADQERWQRSEEVERSMDDESRGRR